jgi:hypothetical protein
VPVAEFAGRIVVSIFLLPIECFTAKGMHMSLPCQVEIGGTDCWDVLFGYLWGATSYRCWHVGKGGESRIQLYIWPLKSLAYILSG